MDEAEFIDSSWTGAVWTGPRTRLEVRDRFITVRTAGPLYRVWRPPLLCDPHLITLLLNVDHRGDQGAMTHDVLHQVSPVQDGSPVTELRESIETSWQLTGLCREQQASVTTLQLQQSTVLWTELSGRQNPHCGVSVWFWVNYWIVGNIKCF